MTETTIKTYAVAETFRTLQGEGNFAGTPALFIRFAGCNMWTGREEDRERDAVRHKAHCPRFCDTDFSPKVRLTAVDIASIVRGWTDDGGHLVVLTGGEPFLQLDEDLLGELCWIADTVQVETNGTVQFSDDMREYLEGCENLWITCSPKQSAEHLKIPPKLVSELKVVYPQYDPLEYQRWITDENGDLLTPHLYVQPCAVPTSLGVSLLDHVNMQNAAQWVQAHPDWSLSLQTHKILNLP